MRWLFDAAELGQQPAGRELPMKLMSHRADRSSSFAATIITWEPLPPDAEVALSFQDSATCDVVWAAVCESLGLSDTVTTTAPVLERMRRNAVDGDNNNGDDDDDDDSDSDRESSGSDDEQGPRGANPDSLTDDSLQDANGTRIATSAGDDDDDDDGDIFRGAGTSFNGAPRSSTGGALSDSFVGPYSANDMRGTPQISGSAYSGSSSDDRWGHSGIAASQGRNDAPSNQRPPSYRVVQMRNGTEARPNIRSALSFGSGNPFVFNAPFNSRSVTYSTSPSSPGYRGGMGHDELQLPVPSISTVRDIAATLMKLSRLRQGELASLVLSNVSEEY